MKNTNEKILQHSSVYFDKNDPENASLYLCFSSDTKEATVDYVIETLQKSSLWSNTKPAIINDEQKPTYIEQLTFIDAKSYLTTENATFVASCFNHEKFPHHPDRWQQWKETLDANYQVALTK